MEIFASNFLDNYSVGGHTIRYSNLVEIAQGGPEIGALLIDGKALSTEPTHFGGPPVFYEKFMFVPRLKKSFVGRHFILCVIDLDDRSIKEIGSEEDLILLAKADHSTVYFFDDNPNTRLKSVNWK